MKLKQAITVGIAATMLSTAAFAVNMPDGSKDHPLRVMMIPADTGTNDITKDYEPVSTVSPRTTASTSTSRLAAAMQQ